MDSSRLGDVLNRLRRRGQALGGIAALLWTIASIMAAVFIACWLDLAVELSPAMRIAALALAASAGVATFAGTVLGEFAKTKSDYLARELDALAVTGGQILAGVDLAPLASHTWISPQPALSAGLATLAVQRAAVLADRVPASHVWPWTVVVRAGVVAGLLSGLLLGAAVVFPGPARAEWLRFSDPLGDHPPYSWITLRVEPGSTAVRYGDGVDVFATIERGLVDAAELVLLPVESPSTVVGQRVPMFQEPDGRWRASLAEVKDKVQYFVRARRARSPKFTIDVLTVPEIEQVRFRLTQPAYARLPVYEGGLPQGGLSGLAGSEVEVRVASNRPLRSAQARFFAGDKQIFEEIWPAATDSREVTGTFPLERSGRLEIQVVDVAAQRSRSTFSAGLTLAPDERPFVRLLEPRATSFATPSSRLPVVIAAEDDFGVARLALFRSLNESRYLPHAIGLPPEPPRRTQQAIFLPLHDYGLSPGDEIKLFARVEDNDPAGAKGSESPVVSVRIISEEEFAQMVRTREGLNLLLSRFQEAQRRLESLANAMEQLEKELAALPADAPLAAELHQQLDELAERMQAEANAIRQLADSPLPYKLDQQLSKSLSGLADQLAELAKEGGTLPSSSSNRNAAERLAELSKRLRGRKEELENETQTPLELLQAVYPLIEDEARFALLYERQRDLAERLTALRGRDQEDDPALKARMRDLQAEQERIQADLRELLDDIDGHAKRLPDRPELKELRQSAEVFAMLVRRSDADAAMLQAAAALSAFSGTEAHDAALRAADILESFLEKGQALSGQGEECLKNAFEPSLGETLGETLQQLLADAGYGSGVGGGIGAGGGYSARRNSLANIGLYGGLPGLAGSQSAKPNSGNRPGAGVAEAGETATVHDTTGSGFGRSSSSAGGGDVPVPLQYRRRVGKYFQRLADELGSRGMP